MSALMPLKECFGPHQLALKRADGCISAAKLLQTTMEASTVDIEHYLDGRDTDFDSMVVACLYDKKEMYPRTDRRQLLDELVEHCSHDDTGGVLRQILRAFLFFFGNSFDVRHHHDISDFSVDHVDRRFTEYISNQGVGIGSVLPSALALLKQHFALQRALKGQGVSAVFATVAGNCFIVGQVKSVASLLVRSFKVGQGQRGALWHEPELLRFVPDTYRNGAYDMRAAQGRSNIRARIKLPVAPDVAAHIGLDSSATPRGKVCRCFYWEPKIPATKSMGCVS